MNLTKEGNTYFITHQGSEILHCSESTMLKILNQDATSRKFATLSKIIDDDDDLELSDIIAEFQETYNVVNQPENQWHNQMVADLAPHHIKFVPQLKAYLQYNDGIYKSINTEDVELLISNWIDDNRAVNITLLAQAMKQFTIHNLVNYGEFNPNAYLNMKNGILNRETKEVIPHTHTIKFLYQLNVEYKPTPTATPYWDKFCAETTPDSENLIRFFNAMFLGKRENEMMGWLVGGPNSGKSTVTTLIEMIYKGNGLTTTSMSSLGASFGLQNITTGIINLDDDISEGGFGNATISIFKKMMNTVATLDVNGKGTKQETIEWKGFLLGASNNLPTFGANTQINAVMKRVCFFNFPNYFAKDLTFIAGIQGEVNDIFSKIINRPFELICADTDAWMIKNRTFYYDHTNLYRKYIKECYELAEPIENQAWTGPLCNKEQYIIESVKCAKVYSKIVKKFEDAGIQIDRKSYKKNINDEIEILGGYIKSPGSVKHFFDIMEIDEE